MPLKKQTKKKTFQKPKWTRNQNLIELKYIFVDKFKVKKHITWALLVKWNNSTPMSAVCGRNHCRHKLSLIPNYDDFLSFLSNQWLKK